jgi:N-acetylglucosaminyldiphosphoundecaprenol N-acetyl-beta-D-mannosaminyltransferase
MAAPGQPRVRAGDLWLDALTEREVIGTVRAAWAAGRGGSIITVNVDVARTVARQPELAGLMAAGSLVVADGMPLVWAARIGGQPLPERVTGSSLVFSLSAAAAADHRSVYLLGGAAGVPDQAATALRARFPGLRIAGTDSPPFGFDRTDEGVRRAVAAVAAAAPDLVLVGLGFPRQERLIERLRQVRPGAWYLGCGGGIPMAAGVTPRAAPLVQRAGLEWAHRLALEPRRLAGRYLRDDLPFAIGLLARAALRRAHPASSLTRRAQIPWPLACSTRSTVSPGTAPSATATANGTRRSCQFLRSARPAQRQASARRPRHAWANAICPYTRAAPRRAPGR